MVLGCTFLGETFVATTTVSPRTIKVSPRNAFEGEGFVILDETFRIEGPRELGLTKSFA